MNLTLRIVTDRRRFILKQARPWVEKYPDIAAPWERSEIEQRFYARIAALPDVASRMPRLLERSHECRLFALEDLGDAHDMTSLYAEGADLASDELDALADYLAALHGGTRTATRSSARGAAHPETLDAFVAEFANRAMRALNHEHIFRVPLDPQNGLDLDRHEPGLRAEALCLIDDRAFATRVEALGRSYLEDGPQLVHGDYFPGSWMRTRDGLRVIDPEFAHCGAAELDLGCAIAHLALARRPFDDAHRLFERYGSREAAPQISPALVARFAAIEVVRRLIGVAQLPIAPSTGWRSLMLGCAREAMLDADPEALFA
jgi:5-methylthioribose kinase